MRRGAVLACLLLLLGCRSSRQPAGYAAGSATVAPGAVRPIPERVREARRRLRIPDTAGALALLEPERPLDGAEPERSWLLARLLVERGEGVRARAMVRALPPGRFRTGLEAAVSEEPASTLRRVEPALERTADPWIRLGVAWLHQFLGEGRAARRRAAPLTGSGVLFVEVEAWLVLARADLEDGLFDRAHAEALRADALAPEDTRGLAVAARASRRAGRLDRAALEALEAHRRVPEAEAYPRFVADVLRQESNAERVRRVAGALPAPVPTNPERRALDGLLAERSGHDAAAREAYADALRLGADPVPVDRDLRRLVYRAGDYVRATRLLEGAVPPVLFREAGNTRAAAWTALDAAVRAAPDASAPSTLRLALARALVGVGAVPEARSVLDGLEGDGPSADLADRLDRYLAFVDAMEGALERGYRRGDRHQGVSGLTAFLGGLAALARRHLRPDDAASFADPSQGLERVPFVGAWLDHSSDTRSPVVAFFRRYGAYLVLGQREGEPPEAVLLALASLVPRERIATRGRVFHHDVAVGYDRRLRPYQAVQGGDLGGACLPDGVWMDADQVRSVEHALRRASARDPGAVRLLRRGPRLLAPDTVEGVYAMGDPAGVAERLILRSLAQGGDDGWASFDTLRHHEAGHLVELYRHLPIGRGLPATLALLARSGFSFDRAESVIEGRAQLAAVAESAHPALALAEMLSMLPAFSHEAGAHAAGYRDATLRMLRLLHAHPERARCVDPEKRLLPQLDRLSDAEIRTLARLALEGS